LPPIYRVFSLKNNLTYGPIIGGQVSSMLNELIVREGYAQVMTIPPNIKYQELFVEAERDARKNKRGLWDNN